MSPARHRRPTVAARGAALASTRLPAFGSRSTGFAEFSPITENGFKAVNHWESIAPQWEQVGPPLRPSVPDLNFYLNAINQWSAESSVPRGLILGVTPELWRLPWPRGADVLAADRNRAMIDTVWPGPRNAVLCADWTQLPLQSASRDIIVCDGGLQLLSYPDEHRRFVRELSRVIAPGGLFVIRMFDPPAQQESPQAVLDDLLAGKIANLNLLKIRLGMALAQGPGQRVHLRQIWETLHRAAPDFATLANQIGWPLEHLLVINTYRDRHARFHFLNLSEVKDLFCQNSGGFEIVRMGRPGYELGERCPTLVLRRTR